MKNKTPQKERAAAPTTAPKCDLPNKPYQRTSQESSMKLIVGGLLLFGDKNKTVFWPFFDVTLRLYIDLRLVSQDGTERSGATN